MRQNEQMDINVHHEWVYDHWKQLVLVAAIILTGYWFWEMRQNHHQRLINEASTMYNTLITMDPADLQKQKDIAQQIVSEYPQTSYAYLSRLKLAALALVDNDYQLAKNELRSALKSDDPFLREFIWAQIANIEYETAEFKKSIEAIDHLNSLAMKTMHSDLLALNYIGLKEYKKAESVVNAALLQITLLMNFDSSQTQPLKQKLIAIQNDIRNHLSS